jgi:hypothetical protein
MKKVTKLMLYLMVVMFGTKAVAQSTLNATGNSIKTSNAHHDYSIGEMSLIHTASNAHLIITQGVLQPQQVSDLANPAINIAIDVYPNPTADIVYLDFYANAPTDVQIVVLDINGKLLHTKTEVQMQGQQKIAISMQEYAKGNYILKTNLKQGANQQQSNFKIVKQ